MAKIENDRRTKITPDYIVKFEKCKIVRDTVKFLGLLQENDAEIIPLRFSRARDLLIKEILIDHHTQSRSIGKNDYVRIQKR